MPESKQNNLTASFFTTQGYQQATGKGCINH